MNRGRICYVIKEQKYRFMLFAYFDEGMSPEEILKDAERRFGTCKSNEIISLKDFGVVDR